MIELDFPDVFRQYGMDAPGAAKGNERFDSTSTDLAVSFGRHMAKQGKFQIKMDGDD